MPARYWMGLAAVVLTTVLGQGARAASPASICQGQRLAEQNCASCHAVGRRGDSPNPDSPPFRNLSRLFPLKNLEEAFAEGIFVGHTGMPEFTAQPEQLHDLLDYIASIQSKPLANPR